MRLDKTSSKLLKELLNAQANGVSIAYLKDLDFIKKNGSDFQNTGILEMFKYLEKSDFLTINTELTTNTDICYTLHHSARIYFEQRRNEKLAFLLPYGITTLIAISNLIAILLEHFTKTN